MPLAISLTKPHDKPKAGKRTTVSAGPAYAVSEINAYIAIRDELFAEAEEVRTQAKLESATVANDFVRNCLEPAYEPYEAQSLPEADAARQRKRCDMVRDRLSQLRTIA